jgi:filamentous hemagglutinin
MSASDTQPQISGNDTTIKGAQATGNTVLASIGGNLNLVSEQDTDDYASKQWQAGGMVMFGFGGGGSVSASLGKADNHYASVTQTSGIGAGDGGYQIVVGGNTDLKGAVIASTADASKNVRAKYCRCTVLVLPKPNEQSKLCSSNGHAWK